MANNKNTTKIQKVLTAESIMFELWERAAPNLSKEELAWFTRACEHADLLAKDLQEVTEGIGCLVAEEGNVGSFQSSDTLPPLLFNISRQLETISGLIQVGEYASSRLLHPELYDRLKEGA